MRVDTAPADTIAPEEAVLLLGPLLELRPVMLAVSGGPDSMALMALTAGVWRRAGRVGADLQAVTVDHGLRPESFDEARFVAEAASRLGVIHHTLRWEPTGDEKRRGAGLQEQARSVRYSMIGDLVRRVWPDRDALVATAHTLDDQIETFFMRLARGSGIDGLAAMAPKRWLDPFFDTILIRPLLDVSKARLIATLKGLGLSWIEDPSNLNEDFERVRVRTALLAAIGEEQNVNNAVASSISRLDRARSALDRDVATLIRSTGLDLHDGAFAALDVGPLLAANDLARQRLLARLVRAYGGQRDPPRLSRLERLDERLIKPAFDTETFGGCVLRKRGGRLYISREWSRSPLETIKLAPGEQRVWDNRFMVSLSSPAPALVQVAALGAANIESLEQPATFTTDVPGWHDALPSLPAFWRDGDVVAVPHLDTLRAERLGCRARFRRLDQRIAL